MIDFSRAEELAGEGKYEQAAAELLSVPVELMEDEAFARVEACLEKFPDEARQKSPKSCYLSFSAALRRGKTRQARQWFTQLAALRDAKAEGSRERAELVQMTCCAAMGLPQTDNAQILLLLSILHHETVNNKLPSPVLSVTCRRPSVLRGAKDLSEWGKNYQAVAAIVRSLQEAVLPDNGAGAVAAALAELLYERNDLNAASVEVASALSCGDLETVFAGYAQLARIARLDGTGNRPEEVLDKLGTLLQTPEGESLLPNYRALRARFDIHSGKLDKVREWLDESKADGLQGCCLDSAYELTTQAKALIALGRCREAVTLLESVLLTLREDIRPLDTAECLMDGAVACELLGSRDLALDKLEEALLLAAPFRYVRVIADGGRVAFHLLGRLLKEERRIPPLPAGYLQKVYEAAKTYSMLFPLLYSQDAPGGEETEYKPDLTATELQVLQLIGEGKSNNQIREQLGSKLQTVKFHVSNIFQKLGAANRVEAVNLAKKMKIL